MTRILVTGSTGFLGSAVVEAALRAAVEVRALVRPAAQLPAGWGSDVEIARADLRAPCDLSAALSGVDTVVHLAADKTGDLYAQLNANVVGTERLIAEMQRVSIRRLVLASSFAVYDPSRLPRGAVLDEACPVEQRPLSRDAYTTTKLLQEKLVSEAAARGDFDACILRPGVVFGPNNYWSARLGQQFGERWVAVGRNARLPLTFVSNCADAVVLAAIHSGAGVRTVNVVDDEQPRQQDLVREYAARVQPSPTVIRVPKPVGKALVVGIDQVNRRLLADRLQVPGSLKKSTFDARFGELRYSNRALRELTGWQPRVSLARALDLTFGSAT